MADLVDPEAIEAAPGRRMKCLIWDVHPAHTEQYEHAVPFYCPGRTEPWLTSRPPIPGGVLEHALAWGVEHASGAR